MSVNRYDIDAYSYFEAANWTLVESAVGDFVYAFDYDELRERVAWMLECEYMHHGRGFLLHGFAIIEIADSFLAARKSVEELL